MIGCVSNIWCWTFITGVNNNECFWNVDCAVTKVAVTKCGKSLFTLDSEVSLIVL